MKQLVVISSKAPRFNNANVFTFNEEFEKYKKSRKKDYLRSEACFSWQYSSLLSDLKRAYFIYPLDKEAESFIKDNYNVIEENEINQQYSIYF